MNTRRWATGMVQELVFDPEQDKEVPCQSTKEAIGRRNATIAQKKCVKLAAAALAEAGGNADVFAAARELLAEALDLQDADRITKRDAHSAFRVRLCLLHSARAVADADDDAAVASARALGRAAAAVETAFKDVEAVEDLDRKIAARRRLEEAEAAFSTLYNPTGARRPRPTSLRVAVQQRVVASQAARRAARLRPASQKLFLVRRTRCGNCEGCRAQECGECKPCLDMPKRGGTGKLCKRCIQRECLTLKTSDVAPASHFSRRSFVQ